MYIIISNYIYVYMYVLGPKEVNQYQSVSMCCFILGLLRLWWVKYRPVAFVYLVGKIICSLSCLCSEYESSNK